MGNTFFKGKKKSRDAAVSEPPNDTTQRQTQQADDQTRNPSIDDRESSIMETQEEELPEDVRAAFSDAYKSCAGDDGEAIDRDCVHDVFHKAFEILGWETGKGMAVAMQEVCDGMKKCMGARGKLRGEEAFFQLLKDVALAPKNRPHPELPQEELPPVEANQPSSEPKSAPKVNNSKFKFTVEAEAKPLGGDQGIMWQEWWKRTVPTHGKVVALPGMAYAVENKSQTMLKIIIDFSQSKNFVVDEPPVRSVSRKGNVVTKVVKPGCCEFVAMISQSEPGKPLAISPRIQLTQVLDNQIYR